MEKMETYTDIYNRMLLKNTNKTRKVYKAWLYYIECKTKEQYLSDKPNEIFWNNVNNIYTFVCVIIGFYLGVGLFNILK